MLEWELIDNKLHSIFKFTNFTNTLAFVNSVGDLAESLSHHPDILLSWGKVEIWTTTHDDGNIVTNKDYELSQSISKLYQEYYSH